MTTVTKISYETLAMWNKRAIENAKKWNRDGSYLSGYYKELSRQLLAGELKVEISDEN